MSEAIPLADVRAIRNFREMAETFRKIAAVSRRPGPLLLRAEAYAANARAIERGARRRRAPGASAALIAQRG